jgi:hypothetical protein
VGGTRPTGSTIRKRIHTKRPISLSVSWVKSWLSILKQETCQVRDIIPNQNIILFCQFTTHKRQITRERMKESKEKLVFNPHFLNEQARMKIRTSNKTIFSCSLHNPFPRDSLEAICFQFSLIDLYIISYFFYFSFQNILEKFNPGARQLISTGKAYLKALHGK